VNPADLPRAAFVQRTTTVNQEPMNDQTPATAGTHPMPIIDRSREMHLLHEALARAQMEERLREAELHRRAAHVRAARKMKRRAEVASLRARRALALAVMQ
jgi:hypothetical protein